MAALSFTFFHLFPRFQPHPHPQSFLTAGLPPRPFNSEIDLLAAVKYLPGVIAFSNPRFYGLLILQLLAIPGADAAEFAAAPQRFRQEVATSFTQGNGLPADEIQLLDLANERTLRVFARGNWFELADGRWQPIPELSPSSADQFVFGGPKGTPVKVPLPWREVRQILRINETAWIATPGEVYRVRDGQLQSLEWSGRFPVNQVAVSTDGALYLAGAGGLVQWHDNGWIPLPIDDGLGRSWAAQNVLGVTMDTRGQLWFACRAGVGCRTSQGWRFYEGKDGLPWNDFTCAAAGPDQVVWFGTQLGAVRFDAAGWHYRQGPLWLPHDQVRQIAVDSQGNAWCATARGLGLIERRPMTLAQKAVFYEDEIARYIQRTPYGFVAEAALRKPADKSSADPQDSDNDGLWTAMYGAGECFAYAATRDPEAKARAKHAFEALRFLQKVTQGGSNSPPKGYVARTVRPIDWPDPNQGRLSQDRQAQQQDSLWKVYEPRWPRSADGKWYWKSDTSSDELDGHFFLYLQYYDLCAETDAEKDRLREVVRDLADHLLEHRFALVDHDGRPTRWAIYGPESLNRDPRWWPERGLNSLSILSYLAVAGHVTGDPKYESASRELIDQHGYAQNAMYPKDQHGPGSGNQSDDEMAFMCYYNLLRCSRDDVLKAQIRYSFFSYWANEVPEMNPFFNFAYAAHNLEASGANPYGRFTLKPWNGWLEDSMATLHGFPLDRLNWPHRNNHRLDIIPLHRQQAVDLYETPERKRGYCANGKVLPVENRHFNHWNTDPWELDYGGSGNELAAGTVFLLPYYLGLYHGFIQKP
jgi:hypothetical protein